MSSRTIHEQGAIKLVQAIVERAVKDYMVTKPGSYERKEVEDFFLSDYFEALTGSDGSVMLEQLQNRYNEKQKKARKGKHHEKNQD